MKKRFLSVFLSLCLCLTLLPTAALAEGSEHSNHCVCGASHSDIGNHTSENLITDWQPVSQQSDITGTGNYYLTGNVTLDSQWTIANDTNIVLCLNGHTLTADNANIADTILIEGTLTITDCKTTGKITGTNNNSSGNHKVLVVSTLYADCTLNLYGGTIENINAGTVDSGGGVHNEGTFNMYGGTITKNRANNGGGVDNYRNRSNPDYKGPAVFNFYGGTIESNHTTVTGNAGHDVYNHGGKMNANGGTVVNFVENTGTITTTDGYAGTTFKSAITNKDTISGGQFASSAYVKNNSGATISGGTFKGTVKNDGTISGGTFKDMVNNSGTISSGTFTTVKNYGDGARIEFNSEDKYQAFMENNRSASIIGPGYIKVSPSEHSYKVYSYRGTVLNGAHDTVTWSNLTGPYAGTNAGCAWDGDSKTLTLTDVYINELDLTDCGVADDITIVIDGDVTINTLSIPETHTGTITVQGQTGRDTDKLYSYDVIGISKGAFLFKNLTAQLKYFNADNSEKPVTLDNASVTCTGNFDLNANNQTGAESYRTLELTNSSLTMQYGDSVPILYAERMTMDKDSTLTLDQAYIQANGLVENGLDGLNDFLPNGYSIKHVKGEGTTIFDTEGKPVIKLTLQYRYTVTFDLNGGTGDAPAAQNVLKGQTATMPADPTLDGYTLVGWYKDADCKNKWNFDTDTVNTSITLYAKWVLNTYAVTYDAGTNGTGTVAAGTKTHGVDLLLSNETFTRSGYTQTGWATTDGGDKAYDLGGSYTAEAAVTLYPVWTQNSSSRPSYSITVSDTANGSVTVSPKNAAKGATVTITTTPDTSYVLETLTVLDKNGNAIELTDLGAGKYSFKMPAGKVSVNATFMDDNTMLNFFADVPAGAYYYDAVLWAAKNGITGGIDENHFGPDLICTRAQIVTFLWRAAGSPAPVRMGGFTDVSADAYYAQSVAWAVENGITTGVTADTFCPDQTCTRAQAVAFLFRYAASQGMDTVTLQELVFSYTDAAQVPAYARSAFNWALAGGIVNGNNGNLMPNNHCTRAQIVTMLYRLLGE